jgi:hypothetical protein
MNAIMLRRGLIALLTVAAIGGLAWLWLHFMEQRWESRVEESAAASENHMLAATTLLRQHRHKVTVLKTFDELNPAALPDGVLIVADQRGVVGKLQAGQLMSWVARGNTLVAQPRWLSGTDDAIGNNKKKPAPSYSIQAVMEDADPISAQLGVRLSEGQKVMQRCDATTVNPPAEPKEVEAPQMEERPWIACVTVPQSDYAIEVDSRSTVMISMTPHVEPLWGDPDGNAVRVYGIGKGHVVMLAYPYFDNANLRRYDHAELLLALARLDKANAAVTIVQHLDAVSWQRQLWNSFQAAIATLACFLLLLLWRAVRRFGPLLPEPENARRALIEHIEASGRWLWRVPGGRDILLEAVREATVAVLRRRALVLQRVPEHAQAEALAQACALRSADVDAALFQGAAHQPFEFMLQIRTLTTLRKHYER